MQTSHPSPKASALASLPFRRLEGLVGTQLTKLIFKIKIRQIHFWKTKTNSSSAKTPACQQRHTSSKSTLLALLGIPAFYLAATTTCKPLIRLLEVLGFLISMPMQICRWLRSLRCARSKLFIRMTMIFLSSLDSNKTCFLLLILLGMLRRHICIYQCKTTAYNKT